MGPRPVGANGSKRSTTRSSRWSADCSYRVAATVAGLRVMTSKIGRAFERCSAMLRLGALAALAACGGSAPPAQTGGATASASAESLSETPAASAPAPAPSPEPLARIKAFDAGSYADARKAFEAAAKKNPNDYQALYNLGIACEKLGDKTAAEGAYKSALAGKT